MCEPCAPDALLEAVRGLRLAEPDLGLKPLLAKLREQRPELGAATKEVREALATLKAESEAGAAPPAVVERGTPSNVALSLACIGCANLTVRGLSFFATTTFIFDSPGATVEQCSFSYPSASRRSLGGAPHRIECSG